jgi:glucosyl-dolichyl phosphate glucuronosyltransferase
MTSGSLPEPRIAYTVAMCTHNHADRLVRTLADLPRVRAPREPWELLVIDNGSSDVTASLLAGHVWPPGWTVRVVYEAKLGLSNARNRAVAEARGEYLIFIDDDETADPDWLCAFERLIDAHRPDAFGGRIRVLFEDERPRWLTDELLGFLGELNHADAVQPLVADDTPFFGGNFGCHRSVFERIGPFDTGLGRKGGTNAGGEDVDVYRRLLAAGLKVWWTPAAVIYHRIQAAKLKRGYFLDLHYRQGHIVGSRSRRSSRLPPPYLIGQTVRAYGRAMGKRLRSGPDHSLRLEMNAAYFTGFVAGWTGLGT